MDNKQQIIAATMQILRYTEMAEAGAARGEKMRNEIDQIDKRLTDLINKVREIFPVT
jgi:hypothetical protein